MTVSSPRLTYLASILSSSHIRIASFGLGFEVSMDPKAAPGEGGPNPFLANSLRSENQSDEAARTKPAAAQRGRSRMLSTWVYLAVAAAISIAAFAAGQALPGSGAPFALIASSLWVAWSV